MLKNEIKVGDFFQAKNKHDNFKSMKKYLTLSLNPLQISEQENRYRRNFNETSVVKSKDYIQHINQVINEVQQISRNIEDKVDTMNLKEQQDKLFQNYEDSIKQQNDQVGKKRRERKVLIDQIKAIKITNGFDQVVDQVSLWSKDRGTLIQKLWKSFKKQLIENLVQYLNHQKIMQHELIQTVDDTLQIVEEQSQKLMESLTNQKKIEFQHQQLKEVFATCANLFHQEEDKNTQLRERVKDLERLIKLWLPNIESYNFSPEIIIRLRHTQGKGKVWGMSNDLVGDLQLRDQMMDRLNPQQFWVKSDIERLIQGSLVVTNDKVNLNCCKLSQIECERLNQELVKLNSVLHNKRLKCKELKMDLSKQKRNMELLVEDLENEKIKNLDFQVIRHKLTKMMTIEKKEKQLQCDLGGSGPVVKAKQGEDKNKIRKVLTLNNLTHVGSNTNSPRKSNGIPIDQIMAKVIQKHGLATNMSIIDQHAQESKQILNNHRRNSSLKTIIPKSPTKQPEFVMNQIQELKQEPLPIYYKEKAQQLLQVISSMMSKLVVQPYRHIKDLFLEEILAINSNPQKASEIAEEFCRIILEVHNKDSRIKLLKQFLGLGEQSQFTQPVGQGLVNLLQDTNLAFDDIFTGEIQQLGIDLEQGINMIKSRVKNKLSSNTQVKIINKSIENIIQQSQVYVKGQVQKLSNPQYVHDYRFIQAINKAEKKQNQDEPFHSLLIKKNSRVEVEDFIEYLNEVLKINTLDFVKDIHLFYNQYLDKSRREFIGGFELHNLFDMNIRIEIPLLVFIKETTNSIIEFDNAVNQELEKIFNKFNASQPQQERGLAIYTFQQAIRYMIVALPHGSQKEASISLKEICEYVDKKKNKKFILIEEFLQLCKDFEFFETLEALKVYNDQNLKKFQIMQKQSTNNILTLNTKNPEKKVKVTSLYADQANEGRNGDNNGAIDRGKSSSRKPRKLLRGKSYINNIQESKQDIALEEKHTASARKSSMAEKVTSEIKSNESSKERNIPTQDGQTPQIMINKDKEESENSLSQSKSPQTMKATDSNQKERSIEKFELPRPNLSPVYLDLDYMKINVKNVDENSEKNSVRSQLSHKLNESNSSINLKKDIKKNFITPTFKLNKKNKPPIAVEKSEGNQSARYKVMNSQNSRYLLQKRMSTPSSSTTLVVHQSPVIKPGIILSQKGEALSLFKNIPIGGNLTITGNKI
ncbi:UNKNOWN [Stylonychia lemnae]|uniref:Uncharacterized protein n=1 Tax=Stylonychia lemnae TaxID=5949 RepID=A0A078B143_STYLE|nr:UNKNOWN [Stylonychia lemnae]|eukprot:CDW88335.1 UNKNOWN [Stylonychia lemnae]